MAKTDEMKINKDEELFDLETLITEGADAQIPIEIEFPNGKKAAAKIRPITTAEFRSISSSTNNAEVVIQCLELGLLTKEGNPIPHELIEIIPMGVTERISEKICEISGIDLNRNQPTQRITDNLESFPGLQ